MKGSKVNTLLIILLLSVGCVTKKKYTEFEQRKQKEALEFQVELSKVVAERDSLKMRITVMDSLLAKEKEKNARLSRSVSKFDKNKDAKKTEKVTEDEIVNTKAVQIYNFCKLIQWPANFNPEEMVIAVAGDDRIIEKLSSYTKNKSVNSKKVRIIKFDPAVKANVLYVSKKGTKRFHQYKNAVKNKPTFIITDDPALFQQGAHVSFMNSDKRVRYMLNKTIAEKAGLKISQELVKFSEETY
jgi:hypothetical protein